jgi:hypothetical protein
LVSASAAVVVERGDNTIGTTDDAAAARASGELVRVLQPKLVEVGLAD